MIVVAQMITTNSEQPMFILDTSLLSPGFKNRVEQGISNKEEYVLGSNAEWNEANNKRIFPQAPYQVDGLIDIVFD